MVFAGGLGAEGERGSCCSVDAEFPSWGMDVLEICGTTLCSHLTVPHCTPKHRLTVRLKSSVSHHIGKNTQHTSLQEKLVSGVISMSLQGRRDLMFCPCLWFPELGASFKHLWRTHPSVTHTSAVFEQNLKTPGAAQTHVLCQRNTLLF